MGLAQKKSSAPSDVRLSLLLIPAHCRYKATVKGDFKDDTIGRLTCRASGRIIVIDESPLGGPGGCVRSPPVRYETLVAIQARHYVARLLLDRLPNPNR